MSQDLWAGGFAGHPGLLAVAEKNLRCAREVGLRCSGYLNAAPEDWWSDQLAISKARECAGAEWDRVEVMMVDWEIPATPYWRCESLADALTAAGKRAEILYTRTNIIRETDTRKFKGLCLAQFDENPNLGSTRLTYRESGLDKPIGPHNLVAGKQWKNTHTVEGVQIDADTFDLDFWEDDMDQGTFNQMAEAWFKNYEPAGTGQFIANVLSSDKATNDRLAQVAEVVRKLAADEDGPSIDAVIAEIQERLKD